MRSRRDRFPLPVPRVIAAVAFMALSMVRAVPENPVKLRLATVTNLPPYSLGEGNALRGVDIDVIREIAARAGVTVEIEPMPWARVLLSIEHGSVDGAFSMYYVDERTAFLDYVAVMHYDNLGTITLASKPLAYEGIDSLTGLTVAIGRGVFISKEFDDAAAVGKFKVVTSDDTQMGNVRMLLAGRVDAVIGVVETMLFYAAELGETTRIAAAQNPIDPRRPGYLALSKASPANSNKALKKRLADAALAVMTDGTYERILGRYLADSRDKITD